jgi:hypothetical protein
MRFFLSKCRKVSDCNEQIAQVSVRRNVYKSEMQNAPADLLHLISRKSESTWGRQARYVRLRS